MQQTTTIERHLGLIATEIGATERQVRAAAELLDGEAYIRAVLGDGVAVAKGGPA